jgi:hypothetical protein
MNTFMTRGLRARCKVGIALPAFVFGALLPSWAAAIDVHAEPNGTGDCQEVRSPCSLPRALSVASAGDVVILQPGVYLESGLVISVPLTLRGATADPSDTVINAQSVDRIFTVDPGEGESVLMAMLTLRGGVAPSGDPSGGGAVLISSGTFEIQDSELRRNRGVSGGAISCYVGCRRLIVRRSLIEDTEATLEGGGIFTFAEADVFASNLRRNTSASIGGGIYNFQADLFVRDTELARNVAATGGAIASQFGSTHILRSALIRNVAEGGGGGVFMDSARPEDLTIENSTFFENEAGSGGAIAQHGSTSVTVVNATLADNRANGFGNAADIEADGSGIFTLQNSILTHPNVGADRPQCTGAKALSIEGGNNLIDTAGTCQGPANNFRRGELSPRALEPLDFHGGPTRTVPPPANSNAVDLIAADCENPVSGEVLIRDQRLFPRPPGGPCTAGAVDL